MNKLTIVGRFAAVAALVGSLGLAAAKPARAETHAYWTSVVATTTGGQQVCGVQSAMSDGGKLSLMVLHNKVHMVAYDPHWSMPPGNTVAVTVLVDGDVFRGQGTVTDTHTVVLANLTGHFIGAFVGGNDMLADFGGVRWRVDLTGSSNAAHDMVECVQEAGGAPIS
jgi:hypothetical protein